MQAEIVYEVFGWSLIIILISYSSEAINFFWEYYDTLFQTFGW